MELKDFASWVGIGVSLFWNYRYSKTANSNWVRGQRLTDFRKIREPIDIELGRLRALKSGIRSLQAFGGNHAGFVTKYKKINKELVEVNLNLQQKIEVADGSNCFFSNTLGDDIEVKWDDLTTLINNVYNNSPPEQKKNSINLVIKGIDDYIDYITKKMDGELDNYLNVKKYSFGKYINRFFLVLLFYYNLNVFLPINSFLINKILSLQIDLTSKDIHATGAAITADMAPHSTWHSEYFGIFSTHHRHKA